jgi:hypothetical protein
MSRVKFLMDVLVPDHSRGLIVDALVLQQAIGVDKVRILTVPFQACFDSLSENEKNLHFEPDAEIVVFIERLFEHGKLKSYKRRVLLSNPEWLTENDCLIAKNLISEFWHKTYFGMELLTKIFPEKRHEYIGFTSLHTPTAVHNYDEFSHYSGRSKTRHTQDVLNIWLKNPALPTLSLQSYDGDLSIPEWVHFRNIKLFLGFLDQEDLNLELVKHGIHICTSQMEGFGHYINEARSIGALIITLDAPPMNELIDSSCGIVIPVEQYSAHHSGLRFIAAPEAIKEGIFRALEMPVHIRKSLGEKARDRFVKEQSDFFRRLESVVFSEHAP